MKYILLVLVGAAALSMASCQSPAPTAFDQALDLQMVKMASQPLGTAE